MNGSLRIGNLFGIPFFINFSWFFVLGLVTLNFGSGLSAQFPQLGSGSLLLGLGAGLLLFTSVVLHELGHSFAAQRRGIKVNSITLFLFGGLASLDDDAKTPGDAFWIAIAGPLVSLALFLLLSPLATSGVVAGPAAAILGLVAYINLILAVFNMIPGMPLDGGNVLRAAIWKLSNSRFRGTYWASRSGQVIGWLAIGLGALSILGLSNIGSFWTLIVGWFILQNASQSAKSAMVQEQLSQFTAADAVYDESPVVDADITLREFADMTITLGLQKKWKRFLVQDQAGRLAGSVDLDILQAVPTTQWSELYVQDYLKPLTPENQVESSQSLLNVLNKLDKQKMQAIAVIQSNGTLLGLLEKSSIIELLQRKQPLPTA
ncbi:MAG: site-2 protease family protein [Cyanobacteria bacterium P01_F01_bin.42]